MARTIVEGIGDEATPGAVSNGARWQGVVFFRPWKPVGGKLSKEKLRVVLAPRKSAEVAMRDSESIRAGVTYRFAVDLEPRSPKLLRSGVLRGRFQTISPINALADADRSVSQRIVVRDARLGRLVREPRREYFEGKLVLLGRSCPLLLWSADLAKAADLISHVKHRFPTLRRAIAVKMVKLANQWRLDGAPAVTERRLAALIVPVTAAIAAKGRTLDLDFDCGDIFAGHGISASLDARGRLTDVHMH
jgi:hypothetical protein